MFRNFFNIIMRNFFAALFVAAVALSVQTRAFAAGYDFAALLNPKNFESVDTVYRNTHGKQVFNIAFDKMSLGMGKTAFNVSIPQKVVLKNLKLSVYAQNLTRAELDKTEFPRPLDFEIDGFFLKIYGKKRIMTISASTARLFKENIIYLSGDAVITVGEKRAKLGSGASVSLKDRILVIKSASAGSIAVRI